MDVNKSRIRHIIFFVAFSFKSEFKTNNGGCGLKLRKGFHFSLVSFAHNCQLFLKTSTDNQVTCQLQIKQKEMFCHPSFCLKSRIPKLLCNSEKELPPFNKQSTLWPPLMYNLKKFSSKQVIRMTEMINLGT